MDFEEDCVESILNGTKIQDVMTTVELMLVIQDEYNKLYGKCSTGDDANVGIRELSKI
jgi:hypothetical protein